MGDLDTEDADCRYFAQNTPCVVVSVDYRLAPEAEFRDILEDCVAGYEWVSNTFLVWSAPLYAPWYVVGCTFIA